jgi:adenylate cyclase
VALAHLIEGATGWSESPSESIKLAAECSERALNLDPTLYCVTALMGRIYAMQGKLGEAITLGEKAIAMGPSYDGTYYNLGTTLAYAGNFEEAIALYKKAMRLNPFHHSVYLWHYAISHLMAKHYDEARDAFNELLQRAQKGEFSPLLTHLGLCAVYAELGKEKEARSHVVEILKIKANFSVEEAKKAYRWRDPEYSERWMSSLRKAGLPG